jgi:hypothetical protein
MLPRPLGEGWGEGKRGTYFIFIPNILRVPTLRVGTRSRTLCVQYAAERQGIHSHAERGNENVTAPPLRPAFKKGGPFNPQSSILT